MKTGDVARVRWGLIVFDEAHHLRDVYKQGTSVRAKKLRDTTRVFYLIALIEEGRMDDEVLIGGIEKRMIYLVEYDPSWPKIFIEHERRIRNTLGSRASAVEHVGSTSVPGLAAKPIIDIIVVVADSSKEDTYLPQLVGAGYLLRVRERDWHQHRMFRTPELDVHIHVFSEGCPEILRQVAFRNRLRNVAADR
jgi:GrpB-like predicted nucleotidyltransferase (UPF0157 family)